MTERRPVGRDIRARIKRAVVDWSVSPEQRLVVIEALGREAYPLHRDSRLRAGALSAIAYSVAGGTDHATKVSAAATAELFMAAGFLFDDVMDEEEPPPGSSVGKQTATALDVLLIAQASFADADPIRVVR